MTESLILRDSAVTPRALEWDMKATEVMVMERVSRIEALRLTGAQVAALLEVSEEKLAAWVADGLSVEESDIIEVGLSLLEGVRRYSNAA